VKCGCERYRDAPCAAEADGTWRELCPECEQARCVVVQFIGRGGVHDEHMNADNLTALEPGAAVSGP
jgi:hypothetical protein